MRRRVSAVEDENEAVADDVPAARTGAGAAVDHVTADGTRGRKEAGPLVVRHGSARHGGADEGDRDEGAAEEHGGEGGIRTGR